MLLLDSQLIMSMDLSSGELGGAREKGIGSALMNPEVAGGVAVYFGSDRVSRQQQTTNMQTEQVVFKLQREQTL